MTNLSGRVVAVDGKFDDAGERCPTISTQGLDLKDNALHACDVAPSADGHMGTKTLQNRIHADLLQARRGLNVAKVGFRLEVRTSITWISTIKQDYLHQNHRFPYAPSVQP